MRCPSCGTENAPDSRFCGGCGARLGASGQRVAPTQKISDDAKFPPRPTSGAGAGADVAVQPSGGPRPIPPQHYAMNPPAMSPPAMSPPAFAPPGPPGFAPPSAPPGFAPPSAPSGFAPPSAPSPRAIASAPPAVYAPLASSPPSGALNPPRQRPLLDDPSLSMPMVARRPWGLIVIVLVIDLGLAIAGGWMLAQGLGGKPAAPLRSGATMTPPSAIATGAPGDPRAAPPTSAPASTGSPDTGSPTAAPPVTDAGSPIEVSISTDTAASPPGDATKRPRRARPPNKAGGPPGRPIDPYDTPPPRADPLPPESR